MAVGESPTPTPPLVLGSGLSSYLQGQGWRACDAQDTRPHQEALEQGATHAGREGGSALGVGELCTGP